MDGILYRTTWQRSFVSEKLNAENALIFRIVHRDNVIWLLENGLHARNGTPCPNYRNIGNVDLIDKRSRRNVSVGPGGTLNDYVPFYFTPYSIMLYNIHTAMALRKFLARRSLSSCHLFTRYRSRD